MRGFTDSSGWRAAKAIEEDEIYETVFLKGKAEFLMQSAFGRYLWRCMCATKADICLYMLADILEPSFTDRDIQDAARYFGSHQRDAEKVYRLLADSLSKRTLRNVVIFRKTLF